MSDQGERPRYPGTPNSSAALWLVLGGVLSFIGGVIAAGSESGQTVGIFIAVAGGALLTIGLIAKGVEVGIRNARD